MTNTSKIIPATDFFTLFQNQLVEKKAEKYRCCGCGKTHLQKFVRESHGKNKASYVNGRYTIEQRFDITCECGSGTAVKACDYRIIRPGVFKRKEKWKRRDRRIAIAMKHRRSYEKGEDDLVTFDLVEGEHLLTFLEVITGYFK